jgi:hypothetical protein
MKHMQLYSSLPALVNSGNESGSPLLAVVLSLCNNIIERPVTLTFSQGEYELADSC